MVHFTRDQGIERDGAASGRTGEMVTRSGWNQSELLEPKILHKSATNSIVEKLRVPVALTPHRARQGGDRTLLERAEDPKKEVRKVVCEDDPGRTRVEGALAWRHLLENATAETGRLEIASGFRHHGRHQQGGRPGPIPEDGRRDCQTDQAWIPDQSSRERVRATETHLPQLVTAHELSEKCERRAMLALAAKRAMNELAGDDPMDIRALAKSGKKRKGEGD